MICLVSRDGKGKIRVAEVDYEWVETEKCFTIHRTTYQFGGKRTEQPDKKIYKGKANRTLSQQVKLEFDHIVKEYTDKGYKQLEKTISEYSESELNDIVGSEITGANGVPKPMLAKQASDIKNTKIFDNKWYASRKINGLRCLIYLGSDNNVHTSSRGSINYDSALTDIIHHPNLVKLLRKNPWLILDGEIFKRNLSLQQINSIARTQVTAMDYEILQFYWYDIVDTNRIFSDRLKIMNTIAKALNIGYNPDREFRDDELRVQLVPHILISGWNNMVNLHNEYVKDGWEGVVIRDPNKPYKPNSRSSQMIKIKQYKDSTYKVVGYELGLRGTEDMVFIMEMEDGRTFKAKPLGNRELKEKYISNFETDYKNHLGDCKYFEFSDTGIPVQPAFISFRYDLD